MKAVLSIDTPGINNSDIQRNKTDNMSGQNLKRGNIYWATICMCGKAKVDGMYAMPFDFDQI